MNQDNRVVVLIDMDCFYCQVEEKLNPDLKGKPIAVVQYNPWKGGGIIAVNYVARAMGVSRHMRGDEAKEKCPEIQLPSVPCQRGKADITKYRDAGKEVAKVLQKFTSLLERASIDEAYLDITAPVQERLRRINTSSIEKELLPNTYALGYDSIEEFMSDVQGFSNDSIDFDLENARQLLVGAVIVSEIRAAVYEQTGYQCSAGIAHNKILAKLVCGMNKPNKQTVLPKHSINILYKTLPVKKVKHLGGKFGDVVCTSLKIKNMGELQRFTEKELQSKFDEKNGSWLYNIARGTDLEPVQARFNPKSIGCCKQFRGKTALIDLDSLRKWLKDLGEEIEDRLEKDALENNRTPKQMVVSFSSQLANGKDASSSRSYNFSTDDDLCGQLFSSKALQLVIDSIEGSKVKDSESNRKLKAPIKFLGISVGKFEDNLDNKTKRINDYFGAGTSKDVIKTKDISKETNESAKEFNTIKRNDGKEYILGKFFQLTDKIQNKQVISTLANESLQGNNNTATIETTLDKQESFFAKFLNKVPIGKSEINNIENFNKNAVENKNESNHVTTPICNAINCGEGSNDTDYSGSTINMEINKSISLFEEDPEDIARVSNMRQLLNNSAVEICRGTATDDVCNDNNQFKNKDTSAVLHTENIKNTGSNQTNQSPTTGEYFNCSECGKTISVDMFEIHADYHFALKLREEERRQIRQEVKEKNNQKSNNELRKNKIIQGHNSKNKSGASITNFLVKIDDSVPMETCLECGKKVVREGLVEHLDFHEAQKLNRELNKKPISNINVSTSTVKRKRKLLSPIKNAKVPCKSIDSFFR